MARPDHASVELMSVTQILHDPVIERATNVIAAGAVASPWWLPMLEEFSRTAQLCVPILGAAWLTVQIAVKAHDWWRKRK